MILKWDDGASGVFCVADVLLDARIPAVDLVVACRGSRKPAPPPESATSSSSTTVAMHLPTCFHLGFYQLLLYRCALTHTIVYLQLRCAD